MKRVETRFPESALSPLTSGLALGLPPAPLRSTPVRAFYIFNFAFLICLSPVAFAVTPYEAIVGRNVFGLKPPTVVTTVVEETKVPAPKIRLQGLTTILGRRQVLFKATLPAKPGEPAREQGSVLSEGQREGEIEVLEINEVAGTVKFNNYGYVMTLNMKDDADKVAAGAVPAPGVPMPGVIPPPGLPMATPMSAPPPGVPMPGNIPTRSLCTAPGTSPTGAGLSGGNPGVTTAAQTQAPTGPPLSPEVAEVLIEVKRQYYKDQGDDRHKVMPPTSITPGKESAPAPQP